MIKLFNKSNKTLTLGHISLKSLESITIDENTAEVEVMQKAKAYKQLNMLNIFNVNEIQPKKIKTEHIKETVIEPVVEPITEVAEPVKPKTKKTNSNTNKGETK